MYLIRFKESFGHGLLAAVSLKDITGYSIPHVLLRSR